MTRAQEILDDVRNRGDDALRRWSLELDGVEFGRAVRGGSIPREALLSAAESVRAWHELQRPHDIALEVQPGVHLERRWRPLAAVGVYVPRRLISTLVMAVVPAKVAGVDRIVICTPPDGSDVVAAAADLLGIREVWSLGGAQAIGALAYGTESIPRVDKIVGPGSRHVNDAKLLVSREVAIDLPAGPSEILVVADDGVDPAIIESELAAQQEHGPDSRCELLALDGDCDAALAEIDARAPEHVALLGPEAEALATRIQNAGSIFVGATSPVAAGDYATGGNHILPTGGWARSVGGVGLETFMKPVTVQRLTPEGLSGLRATVVQLAMAEGMTAHAAAASR